MATFTRTEDQTIKSCLTRNDSNKTIARELGRSYGRELRYHINDLREELQQSKSKISPHSPPRSTTSTDSLTLHQITSDDGRITIEVRDRMRAPKQKDDREYVALHEGRYEGEEVVIKVFCVLDDRTASQHADTEAAALRQLTDRGCKHAPRFIAHFARHVDSLVCRREFYVVMSRVPGVPLWEERGYRGAGSETNKELESAFATAIADVHRCEVDNDSHYDDNIMWDRKERKCYIIDFERAELASPWKRHEDLSAWTTRKR